MEEQSDFFSSFLQSSSQHILVYIFYLGIMLHYIIMKNKKSIP